MGSDQASAPAAKPIVIGQDSPLVTAIEQGLIATGTKVAEVALDAAAPWATLPIVSFFVDEGIKFAITEAVKYTDLIVYELYVSVVEAQRVRDWVAAQASGNEAAIDAAGDNLLKLQGI